MNNTGLAPQEHEPKSRLMVTEDPTRPEQEIILGLTARLECIMNQGARSPIIDECIKNIQNQLENLGLTKKDILEIE